MRQRKQQAGDLSVREGGNHSLLSRSRAPCHPLKAKGRGRLRRVRRGSTTTDGYNSGQLERTTLQVVSFSHLWRTSFFAQYNRRHLVLRLDTSWPTTVFL